MKLSKILKNHTVWITSDTHFGHANICKFTNSNGEPLRPWDDVIEMEDELVRRWNSCVNPNDFIIHCGDVSMNKTGYDRVINRLNGRKILVIGNHDTFNLDVYQKHWEHITSMLVIYDKAIITHIPVHPSSIERFHVNIHGHLHANVVLNPDGTPDQHYRCVSVEHTDYYPVLLKNVIYDAHTVINQETNDV